LYESII